ncbi:MAG: NADPH-dependent F420 reductase [Alphaproteobacteria bacterium]|nr:NADPH-dependent F420 reductase [Alphaproteobacteria bacterium]MDE2110332.1 NADPH-dependent F420 reductase [Alphaproteobacteria bacterium]MDE2494871.1 NADPH-dependent F420 reductase [Alphaproteobacteria bacterium]
MKIAVIGAGNVGGALGKLWSAKAHEVTFGVRNPQDAKVQEVIKTTGGKAKAASVKEAAAFSEVVVLATPWPATEEAVKAAGDLSGKIVIDCTNPLKPDLSGLAIGNDHSAGEEVARWAKGAKVVKAFNTIGAASFENPRFGSESASMLICGDHADANDAVAKLAAELGFDAVDAGPLFAARWLEPLAMLWIYMALKKGLGNSHAFKLLRR